MIVLIYLACIVIIGLPLLMAEIMLGRRAQRNPVDSAAAQSRLAALLADPQRMLLWHSVFMILTAAIGGGVAHGLEPAAGPGLVLQTLPIAFGDMAGGVVIGSLFFVLLVFAAWTSSIALLEPVTAWITEKTRTRPWASALLGVAVVLSFNAWQGVRLFGPGIFDALDYLTSNILLSLAILLIFLQLTGLLPRLT